MTTIQGFLHFLKIMNLASTRQEVGRLCESLHEVIKLPITDTLNIANGLNYSQFLEALLRIAYAKLDESEFAN